MPALEPKLDTDFLRAALKIFGDANFRTDPADCLPYGYDNSKRQIPPQAVCFAQTHEQISELAGLCNEHAVPLVARGLGSGTAGAAVPVYRGVVMSFERMNRIIAIATANRVAVAEPGVTNLQLQQELAQHGFFWPPDPTSAAYCTIGGNLACNSAGPRALKYGTPRENTLGLRAVTGSGLSINTGVYTTKGVVGYDLTRLIIGSEGTLAVITEATLKLTPLQTKKSTLRAAYRDMKTAALAVSRIMAQPAIPCALEFMDGAAIAMIRGYTDIELPADAGAVLIIEIDGAGEALKENTGAVRAAAEGPGVIEIKEALEEGEIRKLWEMRKALSPALRKVAPKKINEDIVVPVSNMAELIDGLNELSRSHNVKIVNFGHAGNGNIHVNLLGDPDDPAELARMQACLADVFTLVLKLKGTLSGEHGIGAEKKQFVELEIEPNTLDLMRKIKKQFDPNNILNPGKLFPEDNPENAAKNV